MRFLIFSFLIFALNCRGAVTFSILNEGPILDSTLAMMRTNGCSKSAVAMFRSAIKDYNASPIGLDLSKFPPSTNQTFYFDSASNLVESLPHQLENTSHSYGLNCFDATFIIADGLLSSDIPLERKVGNLFVPHTDTNGNFQIVKTETVAEAFREVYPEFYRDQTYPLFVKSKSRVQLVGALFAAYGFPETTTESGLEGVVMNTLRSGWRRMAVSFPEKVQIVLCHQVCLPRHSMVSVHAGVLFPQKHGFIYIEKSGCRGPFVRLDCDSEVDLLGWYAGMFKGASRYGYTHHFATFNDSRIAVIPYGK